jgi:hypothetical protein
LKNKPKIDFFEHHGEDWEILKSNLWLYDNSIAFKISWKDGEGVIYGASKSGYFSYLPGTVHTLADHLEGFPKFFADKISDESRKDQYKMQTEKQCKNFIKKIYKQSKTDWKNR